jgi:hypothetical protein
MPMMVSVRVAAKVETSVRREPSGVEAGHEDHEAVKHRPQRRQPDGDDPHAGEECHPEYEVHQAHRPDEPSRRSDRRENLLVTGFAVVQRHPGPAGEERQGGEDDPLATKEVEEMPPEVERRGQVVEVLDDGQARGGDAAHRIEEGTERISEVTGEHERDRSDCRNEKPGDRHDDHPV